MSFSRINDDIRRVNGSNSCKPVITKAALRWESAARCLSNAACTEVVVFKGARPPAGADSTPMVAK
jgi:hypothetical protein